MIDTTRLRGLIAENRLSQSQVARELGIVPQTFYNKLRRGDFLVSEAEKMIILLHIDNPVDIFFKPQGTSEVH